MYTNPIIIHLKHNGDIDIPYILDGYLKIINKIITNNNKLYFDYDHQVSNYFRIMEQKGKFNYCISSISLQVIGMIYAKYIHDGYEIYFFRHSIQTGFTSTSLLRLIKFFLDDFELIEPITTLEYSLLTWINPEKISIYDIKNKNLPKDTEGIENFKEKIVDLQLRDLKEFPPKYWLEIDDINWDRKLLELWWCLNSCNEIALEIDRSIERVTNRLSELRIKYGEIKVPKENDLKRLYKVYIDSIDEDIK